MFFIIDIRDIGEECRVEKMGFVEKEIEITVPFFLFYGRNEYLAWDKPGVCISYIYVFYPV